MGIIKHHDAFHLIHSNYGYDVFVQYASYSSVLSPDVNSVVVGICIKKDEITIYERTHGFRNSCVFKENFMRSIDNVLFYCSVHGFHNNIEHLVETVLFQNKSSLFNYQMEQQKRKAI